MTKIDLQNIQIKHFKSQNDAFEELSCQLFKIYGEEQNWNKTAKFIRKNGAGGDQGVEAYWEFENGEHFGIQAKFFDKLHASQWSQINKSVKTALTKCHKNSLKRYYIYAPLDRTNSNIKTWDKKVTEWKKIKNIEFIWVGQSEIMTQLAKDTPYNKGLKKYWFDENTLTEEWFKIHLKQAKNKAGARYTPNLNIETSAKDNILLISKGYSSLIEYKKALNNLKKNYDSIIKDFHLDKPPLPQDFENNINNTIGKIHHYLYNELYIKYDERLVEDEINSHILGLKYNEEYLCLRKDKKDTSNFHIREFEQYIAKLEHLIRISNNRNYLLVGIAGQGKTHLLCDILAQSVEEKEYVSVLVLGNYLNSNLLEEGIIKNNIDGFDSIDEFLGALDTYAKSKNQMALFMIDAVNEWEECKKNQMLPQIQNLKDKIDRYENIKFLVSCREEYEKEIFTNARNDFKYLYHYGFLDNSLNALHEFCNFYNIKIPSTTLLTPELSNPLILKTICEAFKEKGEFPNGIQGLDKIFTAYIEHLNKKTSSQLDLDSDDEKIQKIVNIIANNIYYKNDVNKQTIKDKIKDIDNNAKWSKSILYHLEKEGFLVITKDYCYFSYQKYTDYLTSRCIINDIQLLQSPNLKTVLKEKRQTYIDDFLPEGVIDCLAVAIPEKFDFELIDLYVGEEVGTYFLDTLIETFYKSLTQRSLESISKRTLESIEHLKQTEAPDRNYSDNYWETLIRCASVEEHPLNAKYLHNLLVNQSMADIDSSWTQFISHNYNNDFDSSYHNASNYFDLKLLISPFLRIENNQLSDETIELISTLFLWLTTTTNRPLRHDAIIASVNILRNKENVALNILEKFKNVKDVYVQEALYSTLFGVVLFSDNKELVQKISSNVFENIFNKKTVYPNIIVRDSAYGIIKTAEHLGVDISTYKEKIEPPYNYPMIKKYPPNKFIEDNYYGINHKEEEIRISGIYRSVKSGDFNSYTMNDIKKWYEHPLSKPFEVKERTEEHFQVCELPDGKTIKIPSNKKYIEYPFFNYEKATNWICKKSYSLGWKADKHGKFDNNLRYWDRSRPTIERIGKKYQWIAYREFLCNLMDNYYYKQDTWKDSNWGVPFKIESLKEHREIDPSFIVESIQDTGWISNTKKNWTHPNIEYKACFTDHSFNEQKKWLKDIQENICKGKGLIQVKDDNNEEWFVLDNFVQQFEREEDILDSEYKRDFGLEIKSFIYKKQDKQKILKIIEEEARKKRNGFEMFGDLKRNLRNTNILEYPWNADFNVDDKNFISGFEEIEHFPTTMEYRNEIIRNSVSFKLPSPHFIKEFDLRVRKDKSYKWEDTQGNVVLDNTIIEDRYNDILLANIKNIKSILLNSDFSIMFTVSTEKRLLPKRTMDDEKYRFPWQYCLTVYSLDEDCSPKEEYHNSHTLD